jgi:hypothetical protein
MSRLLQFLGMSGGGWAGWIAGGAISLPMALLLSLVGTGAGLYLVRRIAQDHF